MDLDETTIRILGSLRGVDLDSADGRIGLGCFLAELERRDPQSILRSAARINLASLDRLTSRKRDDRSEAA